MDKNNNYKEALKLYLKWKNLHTGVLTITETLKKDFGNYQYC